METFPDTEKKLKSRISSYKSAMNREMQTHGCISDGAGKRYMLFWLYFALNDLKKFEAYIDWYTEEFPDDMGEPTQKLCWAVGLNRMDKADGARHMLAELMLSNLYVIPQLLGQAIQTYDIWHSSNYEHPDYFNHIPEEIIERISEGELAWMSELYNSFTFRRMRKKYIEVYGQLQHVKDVESRRQLLEESRQILDCLEEEKKR